MVAVLNQAQHNEVALLVKGCYCLKLVAAQAAQQLTVEALNAYGASYVQCYLFGMFLRHWEVYQEVPMPDLFIAWAKSLHEMLADPQYTPTREELETISHSIISGFKEGEYSTSYFFKVISKIYKQTIGNQSISIAATEAIATGDYDVLAEEVKRVRLHSTASRKSFSPFAKSSAKRLDVIPTGVVFLDNLVGGGFRRNDSYGFLAPTGGGKTTLAGQMSVLAGLQGVKVALILTEQSVDEPALIDRFWALVTGHKSDAFAQYDSEEDFPAHLVSEHHRQSRVALEKNVKLFDFTKEPGDLNDIRAIAAGAVDDFKPDIVILDWAGKLATQMIEQGLKVADNETNALKYIASGMNDIAKQENVATIVFHQLRSDCMSPTVEYDHTDANNCKQFCHTLSYGVVIHPRDDNDILQIRTTKGRWSGRDSVVVKLRGAHADFQEVTGYMRGRGRWEKTADAGKMPTEKPKVNSYYTQALTTNA